MSKAVKNQLLDLTQTIIQRAERERRNLTRQEKAEAEDHLRHVEEINWNEARLEGRYDDIPAEVKAQWEEARREREQIQQQLDELHIGRSTTKSLGMPSLDFSGAQIKDMRDAAAGGYYYKASIDSTAAPMGAVGDYRLSPFEFLRDKARVSSLIPTEQTQAPTVFYFRGSTAASAAAAVAEGAAKPESSPVWTQVSAGKKARAFCQGQ